MQIKHFSSFKAMTVEVLLGRHVTPIILYIFTL